MKQGETKSDNRFRRSYRFVTCVDIEFHWRRDASRSTLMVGVSTTAHNDRLLSERQPYRVSYGPAPAYSSGCVTQAIDLSTYAIFTVFPAMNALIAFCKLNSFRYNNIDCFSSSCLKLRISHNGTTFI